MRAINKKSRMPFTVSLTLIFGYSLLQVAVPPTVLGTQDVATPQATKPDMQPAVELVTQASPADTQARDAQPSIQ